MESVAIGRMDKLGAGDEKQGGRVYQLWNEKFQNTLGIPEGRTGRTRMGGGAGR